jgi:hypothetical protein
VKVSKYYSEGLSIVLEYQQIGLRKIR